MDQACQGDAVATPNQLARVDRDLGVDTVVSASGDEIPGPLNSRPAQRFPFRCIANQNDGSQVAAGLQEAVVFVLLDHHHPIPALAERLGQQVALSAQPADHHVTLDEQQTKRLELLKEDDRQRLHRGVGSDGRRQQPGQLKFPAFGSGDRTRFQRE